MTSSTQKPYAVIGATGHQGGAVVDALLAAGASVRALVRDPHDDASAALSGRGCDVVPADQDDPASLDAAMAAVEALFIMTTFAGPKGTEGEVEHGRAIVDAAVRSAVPRVVYNSVGAAERNTGIPHFESKRRVEEHLEQSGLRYSFVRPTFFMENIGDQIAAADGDEFVLRLPIADDIPLQMVAVRDIGSVSAAALLDASLLPDAGIEIAGDELTPRQIAEAIGAHLGKPGRSEKADLNSLGQDKDQQAMFAWLSHLPSYLADIPATRRIDPTLLDFAAWLQQQG